MIARYFFSLVLVSGLLAAASVRASPCDLSELSEIASELSAMRQWLQEAEILYAQSSPQCRLWDRLFIAIGNAATEIIAGEPLHGSLPSKLIRVKTIALQSYGEFLILREESGAPDYAEPAGMLLVLGEYKLLEEHIHWRLNRLSEPVADGPAARRPQAESQYLEKLLQLKEFVRVENVSNRNSLKQAEELLLAH